MPSKDRSKEPPKTGEPSRTDDKAAAADTEWPRLLARVVEGVVTAELHEFEDNVLAFLDHRGCQGAYAAFLRAMRVERSARPSLLTGLSPVRWETWPAMVGGLRVWWVVVVIVHGSRSPGAKASCAQAS